MSGSNSFSEHDIRPQELRKNQEECIEADIKWLLKHKDKYVYVSCPACETLDFRKAFIKNGFDYVICNNCASLYVNPRPPLDILKKFYVSSQNYRYWNNYIFPASESFRREKIFKPRVERVLSICKKFNIPQTLLLEIGAGFGTFCEELQKLGLFKRVIGVEPTGYLAETCRRRGVEVIEDFLENVQLDSMTELADVLVCFEVIEHLFSPKEFVAKCHEMLAERGIFIVTCPNVQGFDILVLQEKSASIDHEHLNYFHPESLSHLLERCGFKILEIQTPGQLDAELVRNKALDKEIDLSNQLFLKYILLDKWEQTGDSFQKYLRDNNLSSHMWLVAQKT